MDIQPQSQQPISDDQELAKVLAGVSDDAGVPDAPVAEPVIPPMPPMPTADEPAAAAEVTEVPDVPALPELPPTPEPLAPVVDTPAPAPQGDSELDGIKQEAIGELRPLVDKLTLEPQEKFDTYLLLIRSTDDKALVGPAHDAAKAIPDETRRAQALLDIIKEIDFLSQQQ